LCRAGGGGIGLADEGVWGSAVQNIDSTHSLHDAHGWHSTNATKRLPVHAQWEHVDVTEPLTHANFVNTLSRYPIVVINFYAPW